MGGRAAKEQDGGSAAGVARRHGVRVLPPDTASRVTRVAGVGYMVAGLGVVLLWADARELVDYPVLFALSGVLAAVVGLLVLVFDRLLNEDAFQALFPPMYLALLFLAPVSASVAMYFAGFAAFPVGTVTYVLPVIFGYYLLSRLLAGLLFGVVAASHAVLLVASPDVAAAASQWAVLVALLAVMAVLVGGLVTYSDRLAASERAAVKALADANRTLEDRVASQVEELDRFGRLRRFLSPQVADAVLMSGGEDFLAPHRRLLAVFFCDLRGFTAFTGRVEPEEVFDVIHEYYEEIGRHLQAYRATVGEMAGDGIMAYLNDPEPCDHPALRVIELALDARASLDRLRQRWQRSGYDLSYGMGLALGHATLGVVGYEGRDDYMPLGTVVNLASRLCDEARPGQILVDRRLQAAVADEMEIRETEWLILKGFAEPVPAYELIGPAQAVPVRPPANTGKAPEESSPVA